MALKTKQEYIKSLKQLKPMVYVFGEKLENPLDNPLIAVGINATGATYELAEMEEYRDMITTVSPFTGEPVNRFTLPPCSIEDLVMRVKLNRILGGVYGNMFSAMHGFGLPCGVVYSMEGRVPELAIEPGKRR